MQKVYLVRAAQFYKIVQFIDTIEISKDIRNNNPLQGDGFHFIGYMPTENAKELEKHLHDKFANCLVFGEWFDLGDINVHLLGLNYGLVNYKIA